MEHDAKICDLVARVIPLISVRGGGGRGLYHHRAPRFADPSCSSVVVAAVVFFVFVVVVLLATAVIVVIVVLASRSWTPARVRALRAVRRQVIPILHAQPHRPSEYEEASRFALSLGTRQGLSRATECHCPTSDDGRRAFAVASRVIIYFA